MDYQQRQALIGKLTEVNTVNLICELWGHLSPEDKASFLGYIWAEADTEERDNLADATVNWYD